MDVFLADKQTIGIPIGNNWDPLLVVYIRTSKTSQIGF
jgi:hypothetical protein